MRVGNYRFLPTRLRVSPFFAVLPSLFASLIIFISAASAQVCPASVDAFQLTRSYSNWRVNELACKPRDEGGTMCFVVCGYSNPAIQESFYVHGFWYTQAPPNGPYYSEMCTAGAANTVTNIDKQVMARWGDARSAAALGAAQKVASELFATGSRYAVNCPPRPEVRQVQPGPIPPECSPRNPPLPRGRIKAPVGMVELYSFAFAKWKGPITSEFPVFPCDRVRTLRNSTATVMIYTPSGAEDRIDVMADTVLEIPALLDEEIPGGKPPEEGVFTTLWKGTIKMLTPETPGERMRREQSETAIMKAFNVRTPMITTGRRGTEFIIRHDDTTKSDYVFLNSGGIEVTANGRSAVLSAGEQIFAGNGQLSPVYEMPPGTWNSLVTQQVLPSQSLFQNARVLRQPTAQGNIRGITPDGVKGEKRTVIFRGTRYDTIYERQDHQGTPIDVYFFAISGSGGAQAEQNGSKLWGRFVRQPAEGVAGNAPVIWWFVNWVFRQGKWENVTTSGERFDVLARGR